MNLITLTTLPHTVFLSAKDILELHLSTAKRVTLPALTRHVDRRPLKHEFLKKIQKCVISTSIAV